MSPFEDHPEPLTKWPKVKAAVFLFSVLINRAMITAMTVPRLKKTNVFVILARTLVPTDCMSGAVRSQPSGWCKGEEGEEKRTLRRP